MRLRDVDPIETEFDGKTWRLKYTMYGLRMAQYKLAEIRNQDKRRSIYEVINEEIGMVSLQEAVTAAEENKPEGRLGFPESFAGLSPDFVSVMLWAAMLNDDPDLEFEAVERKISDPLIAWAQVLQVFMRTFFEGDLKGRLTAQEGAPDPLARSNGSESGASPESS